MLMMIMMQVLIDVTDTSTPPQFILHHSNTLLDLMFTLENL